MNAIAMNALSYLISLLFIGVTMLASHAFAQIYNVDRFKRRKRTQSITLRSRAIAKSDD